MTVGTGSKPTVWMLNHYANPPDQPGGSRHYDLARHLQGRGYDVVICASSFHHSTGTEARLKSGETWKVEVFDGVKFVWVRTFPYRGNNWRRMANMFSYMFRSYRYGRKLPSLNAGIPAPDIVIGSTVHLFAVLSGFWLARSFKCRFVMEVRDLWPQTPVDIGKLSSKSPITLALRVLEKFLYRRAEKIITVLPRATDYLNNLGIPADKIAWIPNGVDVDNFDAMPPYSGGNADSFTILYLGGHAAYHGLDTLLDAASILQSQGETRARFLLVGDGAEKQGLIDHANALGLENVEFRSPVPKAQVLDVLGEADAVVFTFRDLPVFRYGISPLKIYDYLASGRPILYSVADESMMVEKAQAGITVPPEDAPALAQAVRDLMAMSKEARIQMGRNGHAYAKSNHDIPTLADRLEDVILHVTGETPEVPYAR